MAKTYRNNPSMAPVYKERRSKRKGKRMIAKAANPPARRR